MLPAVSIESRAGLEGLRRVGRVVALTLEVARRCVEGGVSTAALAAAAAGWTASTRHGSPTPHAEPTAVVTRSGTPLVLTSAG
jgi:hypothetical protein